MDFRDPEAHARLETMPDEEFDRLPFGVVGLQPGGIVDRYNNAESELAGLPPNTVLGHHFFAEVAPCMNNFLVGQRMIDEPSLDDVIPYVLTVRMRPTKVQMRLLKPDPEARMYLLIQREG